MSPKTTALAAGLTAMGLFGLATRTVARQDGTPAPAPSPAPSASAPTVLLLSSGKVLRGTIEKAEAGYVVKQRIGPIPVARHDVEGTFPTIEEAYRYLRDRLPKGDPDEHLKLARWCIEQGLKAEARAQLGSVLALTEDHPQARAMIAMLGADAQRTALRDPGVVRTSVEATADDPGKPAELDPDVLPRKSKRIQPLGPPVIFDLPPALAVRRYQEFLERVHPELQLRCAGCHNERSESKYQLLQARTPRARKDPLLLRANLDATLRLVDPANPARSELLTSAIMPHGKVNQPVLGGPNHPAYRALAHWVYGLQQGTPKPADGGVQPAGFTSAPAPAPAPPDPAGFGMDRAPGRAVTPPPAIPTTKAPSPFQLQAASLPPELRDAVPSRSEAAHPSIPPDADFRTPRMESGPNIPPTSPPRPSSGPGPATPPSPDGLPPNLKPLTARDLDQIAGKRKSVKKIDPALLEQVMKKGAPSP